MDKRGFFGIAIYNPKTNINVGTLIRSARCFDASFVCSIGTRLDVRNSSLKNERHIPLFHYPDLESFRKSIPINTVLVCIEISENAKSLHDFEPPERIIYLLGPEDGSIPKDFMSHEQVKHILYIPTKYCINLAVAGSITMYHHNLKRSK